MLDFSHELFTLGAVKLSSILEEQLSTTNDMLDEGVRLKERSYNAYICVFEQAIVFICKLFIVRVTMF